MNLPALRDWVFALKVCVAALLALYLALWIDLPRPYWAVSTVFITSQQLAGATRSKAGYRVYGTLLGAAAAIVFLPNLVNSPELLTLVIALWVGLCLYFSLLDRTPRSYVLMLAGYTAAFIGFPGVDTPGAIFDTAVARAEEITLGILCAALVDSLVLPQSVAPILKSRLEHWFADARAWIAGVFLRQHWNNTQAKRVRLAADAIAFDALATPLRYDISRVGRSAEALATLRQLMLMFLPITSSIAGRIASLEEMRALPDNAKQNLDDMAAWLASGTTDPAAADRLRRSIADIDPVIGSKPRWADLLLATLVARLKVFIDLRQDARVLERHIVDGTPVREKLAFTYAATARTIRHRDRGLALLSAFAAVLAVLLSGAFWIGTKWPDGNSAPMLAAVGCSFFAAQDDPAPQIFSFATAAIIAAVGAAVYLFAILPLATSFEMLILAFAPSLIMAGLLMTQPRTAVLGLGIGVIGFTIMALQTSYTGEFAPFANSTIAAILGVWTAAIVTRLVRSVGGIWSARRLRHRNRRSLVEVSLGHGSLDGLELAALMLDRVGLIAPRLTAVPHADAEWMVELLLEVRIGIDLVELRRIRRTLSPESAAKIDAILAALARFFSRDSAQAPMELLADIDACLDSVAVKEEDPVRRAALLALTDLRRGVFPKAPPYQAAQAPIHEPELAA
jgi:uncharacterized membrane protein YccC